MSGLTPCPRCGKRVYRLPSGCLPNHKAERGGPYCRGSRPVPTPLQTAVAKVKHLRSVENLTGPDALEDAERELGRLYADWCEGKSP